MARDGHRVGKMFLLLGDGRSWVVGIGRGEPFDLIYGAVRRAVFFVRNLCINFESIPFLPIYL